MGMDATARRRWIGGVALLGALTLLIVGQTVLANRMDGRLFVLYWATCFVLTATAFIVAFRDLRALQDRTRQQHRDLLQQTLDDIQAEAERRKRRPPDSKKIN